MYFMLQIINWVGISAALTNFLGIVGIVVWSIRHKTWLIGRIIFSFMTLLVGLSVSLIVAVIHGFIQAA
jgi:hypothetical protein